jgi:hypothetical protein
VFRPLLTQFLLQRLCPCNCLACCPRHCCRVSVGIEGTEDLVADFLAALDAAAEELHAE